MADPQIEKLLIVQDRDIALQKIEQELARIPYERASIEKLIETEQEKIEAASQSLKEKEVQRNELDHEVKAKESDIARFKNQQLEVKKNDEYRALTQQIEQAEADISQLEETEIELMLEIDSSRETFEAEKASIEQRITDQKQQIQQLGEREQNLKDSIEAAKKALANSREGIEANYIEHYDRVKKLTKRAPYVVPIQAHKCGGCHLRVSNEVSRGAMDAGEPHFCDQCARMVYA
ncbi:MAG: zinc ribbon domain-containing protein [Opitutales bacterium]